MNKELRQKSLDREFDEYMAAEYATDYAEMLQEKHATRDLNQQIEIIDRNVGRVRKGSVIAVVDKFVYQFNASVDRIQTAFS